MAFNVVFAGTTSSGKSTLANLLAGYCLLPVGVRETSRIRVDITADGTASSPILEVRDHCSKLLRSFPAEFRQIRSHIENETRRAEKNPQWDHLHILLPANGKTQEAVPFCESPTGPTADTPPFRPGFDLAPGVTLCDLPGIRHESDPSNARILEAALGRASLVVFVFNAEETDSVKEDNLLRLLFRQLDERGLGSRNVLFVLNRKDAFLRDRHSATALRKAIWMRRKRVRGIVRETCKGSVARSISIIPMAAGVMLAAEVLLGNTRPLSDSDRNLMTERLEANTARLGDDERFEALSRSFDHWTPTDRALVYRWALRFTGAKAFGFHFSRAVAVSYRESDRNTDMRGGVPAASMNGHCTISGGADQMDTSQSGKSRVQERIEVLYERAEQAWDNSEWREAAQYYHDILILDPSQTDAAKFLEVMKKNRIILFGGTRPTADSSAKKPIQKQPSAPLISYRDSAGWTPLHSAAERGDNSAVGRLLVWGARVNALNHDGWAPLHIAAQRGHLHVVERLLDRGANIQAAGPSGKTALALAEEMGNTDVVDLLRRRGARG